MRVLEQLLSGCATGGGVESSAGRGGTSGKANKEKKGLDAHTL